MKIGLTMLKINLNIVFTSVLIINLKFPFVGDVIQFFMVQCYNYSFLWNKFQVPWRQPKPMSLQPLGYREMIQTRITYPSSLVMPHNVDKPTVWLVTAVVKFVV